MPGRPMPHRTVPPPSPAAAPTPADGVAPSRALVASAVADGVRAFLRPVARTGIVRGLAADRVSPTRLVSSPRLKENRMKLATVSAVLSALLLCPAAASAATPGCVSARMQLEISRIQRVQSCTTQGPNSPICQQQQQLEN